MNPPNRPRRDEFIEATDPFMERADRAIHVLVGIVFLVIAAWMGGYSIWTFFHELSSHGTNFFVEAVELINGMLLVLIVLEVLSTVRSRLRVGHTALKPFLIIGIISATRQVLLVGAESSVPENLQSEANFRHLMIELGVNALVVLALAVAMWFFSRSERNGSADSEAAED
jgi:uncharacterized membrane protein (DUF373 family)